MRVLRWNLRSSARASDVAWAVRDDGAMVAAKLLLDTVAR